MSGQFSLHVYRRLCRVDAIDRAQGRVGVPRFEYLTGTEAEMRGMFAEYRDNPQVLAVELRDGPNVVDRFDRLLGLLPEVTILGSAAGAPCRAAILEPRLLANLPADPAIVPKEADQ